MGTKCGYVPENKGSVDLMVGEAGIEPTTPGLEGRCSIRLSYSPTSHHCNFEAVVSCSSKPR